MVTTLAVGGVLATLTAQVLINTQRRALNVGNIREDIERTVVQMEAATRDYMLTHDPSRLDAYGEAANRLPDLWDRMAVEIDALEGTQQRSNAQLRPLAADLKSRIENWQTTWADVEIERSAEPQPAPVLNTDTIRRLRAGEQLFDEVRRADDALDDAVKAISNLTSAQRSNVANIELWLLVVLGIVSVGSGFVALRTAQREARVEDEAREQVENEQRLLQTVIDNLPVPVMLLTVPEGRVILQNHLAEAIFPARIWDPLDASRRIKEFNISKPDGTLMDPQDMPLARVLREDRAVSDMEFTATSPTGARHMLAGAAPIADESGEITAAVVVMQDVTRMRELDQRKDEFIATAAHELRNPLTALSGHHQLLSKQMNAAPATDPGMVRHVQVIGRQITRLTELIERLLDASRIQLGRLTLDAGTHDLAAIARNVVADYESAEEGRHPMEVVTPPHVVGYWDATRMEEVLSNLVGNALRYTPEGSLVRVEIEDQGTWVRVSVSDRGPGIPADQRQRLFDRYYQTGPLNAAIVETVGAGPPGAGRPPGIQVRPVPPKKQGLGLGLYISSEIVKAHGGDIGVDPNSGGGSTFWFRVPKTPTLP